MSTLSLRQSKTLTFNLIIFVITITILMLSLLINAHAGLQNNGIANPTKEKRKVLAVDTSWKNVSASNLLQLSIKLPYGSNKKLVTPIVSYGPAGSMNIVTTFQPYNSLGACKSFTRKWRSKIRKLIKKGVKANLNGFCVETRGREKKVKAVF